MQSDGGRGNSAPHFSLTGGVFRRRLVSRGTETPEKIRGRLLRAEEEAEYMPLYDAILVNDDLDTCVRELHSLIRNAHMRSSSRAPFISQMKQELKELNQGGY